MILIFPDIVLAVMTRWIMATDAGLLLMDDRVCYKTVPLIYCHGRQDGKVNR